MLALFENIQLFVARVENYSIRTKRVFVSHLLRAYSFCAVFLFRFINPIRNRRVQKEQFSSGRNNFHGNKMANSLISNRKGKKYKKNYTRMKFENTGGSFDKLLVFVDRVIFFVVSRQSSNLYSWIPSGNGELLLF